FWRLSPCLGTGWRLRPPPAPARGTVRTTPPRNRQLPVARTSAPPRRSSHRSLLISDRLPSSLLFAPNREPSGFPALASAPASGWLFILTLHSMPETAERRSRLLPIP